MDEQELPDGPVEHVLRAMRGVLDKTGEESVRITSLQVAMLADQLLKLGVTFPQPAAGLPEPEELPEGHPLPWDELKPYEQEQGGYWLPTPATDIYGSNKVFVRVAAPGAFALKAEDLLWSPQYAVGQLVNEQPRAGILTHRPTGLMEISGSRSSQLQNKAVALTRLTRRVERVLGLTR